MIRSAKTSRLAVLHLLLASMLLYVSGVDLGLHLELAHSHETVCAQHDHDSNHQPSPNTPVKHDCPICDMLIGISKPVALVADAPVVFTMGETVIAPVSDEIHVDPIPVYNISQRGPPISA